MFISNKWMVAPFFAAASFLFTADAPTARAQHFRVGGISLSLGHHGYHSYGHTYRSYAPRYRSHVPVYRSYRHRSHFGHGYYHDTSHYDYHPTEIRRHGNHYDVIPGHYDYHRTGHFHH